MPVRIELVEMRTWQNATLLPFILRLAQDNRTNGIDIVILH